MYRVWCVCVYILLILDGKATAVVWTFDSTNSLNLLKLPFIRLLLMQAHPAR